MIRPLGISLVLWAATGAFAPTSAQDSQEERDRGFLTALIEDNLSAPGLAVRIDGFEGALSSEASLERLTVSDDAGAWLHMEEVVLDWNRSALFQGRLEVNALTARLISVERAPLPPEGVEALPDAGASGFSIPDLPVAVDIAVIRADRIDLGAALLGQDLSMTLEARASLADGSAEVVLEGSRLDDVSGRFDVAAQYDAETTETIIDLVADEAKGGLAATLLQLPGAPAMSLSISGQGPLDDFAAQIALASDEIDRLAGRVTVTGTPDGRGFQADLGGDLTPLLAPRYHPFFGPDTGLRASGVLRNDGATELTDLTIATEALSLSGRATIAADGWPEVLDFTGEIAAGDGGPVVLPTADAPSVGSARFTLRHDAATSENWALDFTVDDFRHPTLTAERATVEASGVLSRNADGVTGADADLTARLEGLAFADTGLNQAVGPEVVAGARLSWQTGGPVSIDDLALRGSALQLDGTLGIATDGRPLPVTVDMQAAVADLSRLAQLTGQDALAGDADLTLQGAVGLDSAFDLTATGAVRDLTTGIAQADRVMDGTTQLALSARRDANGTYLDALDLSNPQLRVVGQASVLTAEAEAARADGTGGGADLDVTLTDGTLLDPRLDGPVTARLDLTRQEAAWTGEAAVRAPKGVEVDLTGRLGGAAPALDLTVAVPDLESFVPGLPGAVDLTGRAFATDGIWSIDASASGPWDLSAEVAGTVNGDRPELRYTARLPDFSAPIPALETIPALVGPVALDGSLVREGAAWLTDTRVTAPADVTMRLRGALTGAAPRLDLAATVPQLDAFVPDVTGALSLDASLIREAEDWRVTARALGPFGLRVSADSVVTDSPLAADIALTLPRLADLAPGLPGGLELRGRTIQQPQGWQVDLEGTGPYDAALAAAAQLLETGPEIALDVRIPDASSLAPQVSGPLDLNARAAQRDGIWVIDAEASGPFGARATANARLAQGGPEIRATASLPNASVVAPQLRGPLNVVATASQSDGVWRANATAGGPFGASLDLAGIVAGAPLDVTVDLAVPDIAPLAGDISGPLRVRGAVTQPDTSYAVDLSVLGPSGTQATVAGSIAPGGTLGLSVQGSAPLGLANAVLSAQRLSGTAAFDLSINGPPDISSVSGTIRTQNAALSLPTLRNGLAPVVATITLSSGRAEVDARGTLQTGGLVTIRGPISLAAPYNANLRTQIGVILQDPSLYTAAIEGELALTGPLIGGAVLSGQVSIEEAEIVVPSSGLTAIGDLPDIQHVFSPRPVRRTLARAGLAGNSDGGGATQTGPGLILDLVITSRGRIFVRGRGLDAELGGSLRLTGTTTAPITAGAFQLVRGRLDVLQQRFDLDEGEISFQGDLTPYVRLVAITETDALTASISVEGPADDIAVTFGSTPDVPQEEILAQIFFGRDLSQLSPLQALQLANSVAVLAGRGSGGLLEKLRGNAGLDDLDLTTDAEGNTALRAGKYISDNVYTDVQIDGNGDATISLNLDLTPDLTVRGSTGASGESSLGIFFERDY